MTTQMTEPNKTPWTGPSAGLWLDLDSNVVAPLEDAENLCWCSSTLARDVGLAAEGIVIDYAPDGDGLWWRREIVNGGAPGHRRIKHHPAVQIERNLQMTRPILLERLDAGKE
jgi:hypothetical protein